MPSFGKRSKRNLDTLKPDLQAVLNEAIRYMDFSVIEGFRGEADQNKYFNEGKSKLRFPQSNHNKLPSKAVDLAPYPSLWSNIGKFYELADVMFKAANTLGVKLRWGGDWSRDGDVTDQKFNDLPHFELKGKAGKAEIKHQDLIAKSYGQAANSWNSNHTA